MNFSDRYPRRERAFPLRYRKIHENDCQVTRILDVIRNSVIEVKLNGVSLVINQAKKIAFYTVDLIRPNQICFLETDLFGRVGTQSFAAVVPECFHRLCRRVQEEEVNEDEEKHMIR